MKKIILALVLVMLMAVPASAGGSYWMTYIVKNTTGVYQTTVIPTTSIIPHYNNILGFDVMQDDVTKHSENWAAVYDETAGTLTGECLGEAEAIQNSTAGKWWYPSRVILYGVTVRQGPNTAVFVYFEV